MEPPDGIIEKLRCDYCRNYLSCGPIHLNYKTNKVCCGRCTTRKQSATNVRYTHYETIASALLFPCKYTKHGCTHKLQFTPENPPKHEQTCGYRKRACPMSLPELKCKWMGRLANVLHHCKIAHAAHLTANPLAFQHDVAQLMHDTYLCAAFARLFIVNVRVADAIIVHVRLVGDEDGCAARTFKYTLKLHTKTPSPNKLIKDGGVIVAENATNDNALIINTDNLTSIFGGVSLANFRLTIEQTPPRPKTSRCKYCLKDARQEGAACADCKQVSTGCRYAKNGCTFTDVCPEKCQKHEQYFCKYVIECPDCNLNVNRNTLFKHYVTNHGAVRAKSGKMFHVNEGYKQFCVLFVADDVDTLFLCKFSLACYRLLVSVFSPFATCALRAYCCEVRINDPGHRFSHKLTPKVDLSSCCDWTVNVNMYNYPMWRQRGLDLCVFVRKKKDAGEL